MLSLTNFLYFLILHFVIVSSQINLDLTNLTNYNENNVIFSHNCLYVDVKIEKESDPYQIISYCMNEWSSKWNIEVDYSILKFTFNELYKLNISSEQLYLWSASIDMIENYQFYLNQLTISNDLFLGEEIFYNCTLPRFGNLCEYSLDIYENNNISLNDMIYNYYQKEYSPKELTCYIYLECNYNSNFSCLDWSQICDTFIDCYNGIDEKYCWQLELNKCEDNEYQCSNGQCISIEFFSDDINTFECMDETDEINKRSSYLTDRYSFIKGEPTFSKEDVVCFRISNIKSNMNITSSCVSGRDQLVLKKIFSDKPKSISDNCWLTYTCLLNEEYLKTSECEIYCEKFNCKNIIYNYCPNIFFLPNEPIAFGHIYFAYVRNSILNSTTFRIPRYICYNDKLCDGFHLNKTIVLFNNMTCREPKDFPITIWEYLYNPVTSAIKSIYLELLQCNTIIYDDPRICNNSLMYRCMNSNKCISKRRFCDQIIDCPYGDDEQCSFTSENCTKKEFLTLFKCSTVDTCIHPFLIKDGECNCGINEYDLCDDEIQDLNFIRKNISFERICDGSIELIPIYINGRYETDETECEEWKCNNIYTRCNGIWNCPNGIDELGCNLYSRIINCSSNHHICISSQTNQPMCLSIDKTNDGNIDCLGATDETQLCQEYKYRYNVSRPDCRYDVDERCANFKDHCYLERCGNGMNPLFCKNARIFRIHPDTCTTNDTLFRSDFERFFCEYFSYHRKTRNIFFSLDQIQNTINKDQKKMIRHLSILEKSFDDYDQKCHRGLSLNIWSNNLINQTCLCPPSFYGNRCEYQNQRVSLTLKLGTYSDSRQTLFVIIILLIDNDIQQTIHSYHQFTYFYIRHCKIKFNIYLIYSQRRKNENKNYSIHIDIYEKKTLKYRGSFLSKIQFNFLPVHRLALQFTIPHLDDQIDDCIDHQCINGRCIRYSNIKSNNTFCQCHEGWSGKYCTIKFQCICSLNSLCLGILSNNQSLCVCPVNKWGSKCLLQSRICQLNQNEKCFNDGECIPINENIISERKFLCICKKGFSGDQCEIPDTKLILSFDRNILLPDYIRIHFIQTILNNKHENGSTYKLIPINENSVTIYWSRPFHIALAQLNDNDYYLISVKKTFNRSETIIQTLNSSNNCKHISELLNETIVKLHLIRRIKYYHIPCGNTSLNLSCFYDENYFCLCYQFGIERLSNCFELNSKIKLNCLGESNCQNDAECLQDRNICPQISVCICPKCFYGGRCQWNSNLFGLSLDSILGYFIQPNISILSQPFIIQISILLIIIMSIVGLINSVLCLITFKNKETCQTASGIYLFTTSIITLITIIIFLLKFLILLIAQIMYIENQIFLYIQCYTLDFFLQVGLNIDRWLCACVAIERLILSLQGSKFNKRKSQKISKIIILIVILLTILTFIHDPIHRRLINDNENEEKRIWCIVNYSSQLQIYNSIINIFHFFLPFIINLISPIIIIKTQIKQKLTLQPDCIYKQLFYEQCQRYNHLIIGSIILVLLSIPRLIISFISICLKTNNKNSWLFLFGYLISFIPLLLHFILFVLSSKLFKEEFQKCIRQYRQVIQRHFIVLRS